MRMHWQPGHEGNGRKVRTNVQAGKLAELTAPGKRKEREPGTCPFSPIPDYLVMNGEEGAVGRMEMGRLTFVKSVVIASDFTTHLPPGYEGDMRTPVRERGRNVAGGREPMQKVRKEHSSHRRQFVDSGEVCRRKNLTFWPLFYIPRMEAQVGVSVGAGGAPEFVPFLHPIGML